MKVRDLSGKLAVVTGAGSGIGRATALACAQRGAHLALCDLNEAGLEETAKLAEPFPGRTLCHRVDVSREDDMAGFAEAVHGEFEAADLLVNNAGVGLGADLSLMSIADWDWILGINLRGVFLGCHFFVPRMQERGRGGHVVNIASMAGYVPADSLLAYCTTKSAVIGFSESLRVGLAGHGIGVTAICPGIINTPIVTSSRMRGSLDDPELRRRGAEAFRRRNYTPERVAQKLLRAVERNRAVAPVSPEAWIFYFLKRWVPGLVLRLSRFGAERAQRQLADAGAHK